MANRVIAARIPTHPGLESTRAVQHELCISPNQSGLGYLPVDPVNEALGFHTMMKFGQSSPYHAFGGTETKDGGGETIADGVGGVVFTCSGTADQDVAVNAVNVRTLALGEVWKGFIWLTMAESDMGFGFGFATAATTELYDGAPADGVFLYKAKSSGNVVGHVRENGNAADASGTLLAVTDGSEAVLAFECCVESTTACWGRWWAGTSPGAMTATDFTANQLAALLEMYNTTVPSLTAVLSFRDEGTGGAQVARVRHCWAGVKK